MPNTLAPLSSTLLNHLLAQAPWARLKAGQLAGLPVRIVAFPLDVTLVFDEDGWIAVSDALPVAKLVLTPWTMIRLVTNPDQSPPIDLQGDAQLAARFGMLLRTLTWDAEADLAHLLGDTVAHAVLRVVREWVRWQSASLFDYARTWLEYASEEAKVIVRSEHIAGFVTDVDNLRDCTARLTKRIECLAQRAPIQTNH